MPVTWLMVPYVHAKTNGLWIRTLAINEQNNQIASSGGAWAETEIDGDKAICNVRASDTVLNQLDNMYVRMTDNEAQAAWTPTRAAPEYNPAVDAIRFRENERVPCIPLQHVADRVKGVGSVELMALIGLWLGIGFGLGWRLPHWVAGWAARNIGEPTTFWRELLQFTFGSSGGFPENSTIIDDFDRANENPMVGWGNTFGSDQLFKIVSNQAAGQGAGVHCRGYWTASTYGLRAGIETYFDVPVAQGAETTRYFNASTRIADPGGTVDMYEFSSDTSTLGGIYRVDNGSGTLLGSTFAVAFAGGDSMGMEHVRSTVAGYRKTGGNWVLQADRADITYTGAGYLGLRTNLLGGRFDNFGGGSVAYAPISSLSMFPKMKMTVPILQGRLL